jgi:hypothetical protein
MSSVVPIAENYTSWNILATTGQNPVSVIGRGNLRAHKQT